MDLPRFLQIEPVGQCNLRCRMCPIQFREEGSAGKPPAFMEVEVFRRLVDQFTDVEELHLQGLGEPLLHPRFFEMVRYAAQRGIRVSTNTNMTVWNSRRARECIDSGLHTLHASLDGATAETYEWIRTDADFSRVIANLSAVVAAKHERASELPHIRIVVVAMKRNLHELAKLVELVHSLGLDTIWVQHLCHDFGESSLPERYWPMRDFVDQQTLLNVDLAEVEAQFGVAHETAKRLGVELRLPKPRGREHAADMTGRQRCDWPWRGAYLSYSGQAMPCCMVATPDRINFGNMAQQGAEQIWNNEAYNRFRSALDSDAPPEICRSCALYSGTF